jgi:hypothetical protein
MNILNHFFNFKNNLIKKKTLWLLACFGILTASSCKKKQVEPIFQNTFSCKINGQLWEPNGENGFLGFQKTLSFYFAPGETGLGIQADNKKAKQFINISCLCENKVNTYRMRNASFLFFEQIPACSFVLDTLKSHTISITKIDDDLKIITGTFEYTVYKTGGNCEDTIRITDEKFNLKL